MKKNFISIILLFTTLFINAQIISLNTTKTKIEIEGEARGGKHHEENADGHGYARFYAKHNFLFTKTSRIGIEGRYEANNGDNHYLRFEGNIAHTLKIKARPLYVACSLYGEASTYAVERFDGHITGIYTYNMNNRQQQGVGVTILLNNPSGVPIVPMFVFNKQFNHRWSLNFMTYLATLNYDINKKIRLSGGYNMFTENNWIGNKNQRYYASRSYFSPQLSLQWKATWQLIISTQAGYRIPMSCKLYTKSGSRKIGELEKVYSPFCSVRATLHL